MVDKGATTIWESWEGIDDEGDAHDSLNHYSKGTVLRFLHEHTLGLRQDAGSVAWRSIVIAPDPGPGITWARGSHETPQRHHQRSIGSSTGKSSASTPTSLLRPPPASSSPTGPNTQPGRAGSGLQPHPLANTTHPTYAAAPRYTHAAHDGTHNTRKDDMTTFPDGFLWGAATAGHQIEGNNVNSDWWARELTMPGMELSGDACDSYHRYREDIDLLADAGLNSYRFSLEWSRIEPVPGHFSKAELAHYRRMIEYCFERNVTPVVTLQHFTTPQWFANDGGWLAPDASEKFQRYVTAATHDPGRGGVGRHDERAQHAGCDHDGHAPDAAGPGGEWQSPTVEGEAREKKQTHSEFLTYADPEIGRTFTAIHHAAREIVRAHTNAKVGWTIAAGALTAAPGGEEKMLEIRYGKEDVYWEGSRGDDFVGVQAYSSQEVDAQRTRPAPAAPRQHPRRHRIPPGRARHGRAPRVGDHRGRSRPHHRERHRDRRRRAADPLHHRGSEGPAREP